MNPHFYWCSVVESEVYIAICNTHLNFHCHKNLCIYKLYLNFSTLWWYVIQITYTCKTSSFAKLIFSANIYISDYYCVIIECIFFIYFWWILSHCFVYPLYFWLLVFYCWLYFIIKGTYYSQCWQCCHILYYRVIFR